MHKRGTGRAVAAAVRTLLKGLRKLKEGSTGRLWDTAHKCESMLERAASGRRSTFKPRKPVKKRVGKKGKASNKS